MLPYGIMLNIKFVRGATIIFASREASMALELFTIFSSTGLVLWQKQFEGAAGVLRGDPVTRLIEDVLLQERGGAVGHREDEFHQCTYSANATLGLIFLAVYHKGITLPWISDLVDKCEKVFTRKFEDQIPNYGGEKLDFENEFQTTLEIVYNAKNSRRAGAKHASPRRFGETKKGKDILAGKEEAGSNSSKKRNRRKRKKKGKEGDSADSAENKESSDEDGGEQTQGETDNSALTEEQLLAQKFASMGRKKRTMGGFKGKTKKGAAKNSQGTSPSHKGAQHWRDPTTRKLNKKESARLAGELDRSARTKLSPSEDHLAKVEAFKAKYLGDADDGWDVDVKSEDAQGADGVTGWFSSLSAVKAMKDFASRASGTAVVTEESLSQVRSALIGQLVRKNVAREVADVIMESVSASVVGQSLSTFERVDTVVADALEASVGRILTPKRDLDIVREVQEAKKRGVPYTIVFVGINGVGKSTSLAKVCYHLLQKSFRPLIAACDTFRSGAVEQLKVHADCLGVDVFEQGYASDSAQVAKAAITHARREGHDVVLVDTAGRMQNNRPHMIALSSVITVNQPDLILFVGEALAGNDAIDQLTQFNQALTDHATTKTPRLVDGIVLTKFDCVDDKVGAAVSMVHKTGRPIMFVGTGQKYTHLRKLNVKDVLRKLFTT